MRRFTRLTNAAFSKKVENHMAAVALHFLGYTPNITVTIGHHTRIYFAFVTTAPTELDSQRRSRCTPRHSRTSPASRRNHSRSTRPAHGGRRDGAVDVDGV